MVEKMLIDNDIEYNTQKRFPWLGLQSLDFFLPKQNIGIECQGTQHFKALKYFGGERGFSDTIKRDKLKRELCIENNVKLIYFTTLNDVDADSYMVCGCCTDMNKLLSIIQKNC